jgi:hypothetical protein
VPGRVAVVMNNRLAALGPFFAVDVHQPMTTVTAPWLTFTELLGDLDSRVQPVRSALALGGNRPEDDVELRVAASVAHLGVVARLLAPAIGAMALGEQGLSLDVADLRWQNQLGGPFPLSTVIRTGRSSVLQGDAVEALTLGFAGTYSLSGQVLWGNVGSAANSAAGLIGAARPELAPRARMAADTLLADHRVDGGQLRSGEDFRRKSCCLLYRLTGDRIAVCGDCVLAGD